MTVAMLHTAEDITCPYATERRIEHFEMLCEDCDALRLVRLSFGAVDELYRTGRITQDQFEAYANVWAVLSPTGSLPEWRAPLEPPTAARIARKLTALAEERRARATT